MHLDYFENIDNFYLALKTLFEDLNIPVNYIAEEPARPRDILTNTFKEANPAFKLMEDVYFLGMVDDAAFEGNKSITSDQIKTDYDGLLLFGVTLKERGNGLLPTRSHLAEITRAFNREFHYTPVVVVFRYNQYIAFANAERQKYKQEWREGEKAGKVSLLRDVKVNNPHTGHLKILQELAIARTGRNAVNSFGGLYKYWQEVFNVSVLNREFYKELSNWYFWALKKVTFPGASLKSNQNGLFKEDERVKEHNAKNLIRLLTRLLFVWFVKEKNLIPEELFDKAYIKAELLKEFQPQRLGDLFAGEAKGSTYYKAVLQNLFFATLNQTMGKREFRKDKQHMNVTNLMRYESCFKNPGKFIKLVEDVVPFMNGGLFECLDQPDPELKGRQGGDVIIYQDGFSDRNDNKLVVPDYIFFGTEEYVDLSEDYGNKSKTYKSAAVKGLINILNSYKFTITENTPIEEDVALDPELLGRVFENLLASYNPETKTTARKQTGSFYTPREIVNYMVDESLIAYFKNKLSGNIEDADELDTKLRQLISFDNIQPFQENKIKEKIIKAIDACSILDPACGSGAFPMGILQKMVHLLHKLDPGNEQWKQRQIDKVNEAIEKAEEIEDSSRSQGVVKELKEQIKDIEDSFENNELDYGRKLYLLENCIYGVDIQAIATQISKLRFFISLIVDQSVDKTKENFGIRPLPNLETKFVAANTLIGIEKPKEQGELFDNSEVEKLEDSLKKVRHKIFNSKSPRRKRELRDEDKALRNKIAELLIEEGWENKAARQLASWDPYDQNASSPFFDSEWMFGIRDGFDIVIGNPPYLGNKEIGAVKQKVFKNIFGFTDDMYNYFYHNGVNLLDENGIITYITPNTFLTLSSKANLRKLFLGNKLNEIFLVGYVFKAYVDTIITSVINTSSHEYTFSYKVADDSFYEPNKIIADISLYKKSPSNVFYPPTITNSIISNMFGKSISDLNSKFRNAIVTQSSLRKNHRIIKDHQDSLKAGDLTLLGLVSEGAQGLVTGNNSKYLAAICEDREEQAKINIKLKGMISAYKGVSNLEINDLSKLYDLAEEIKIETNNPIFFGKYFLYKTVLRKDLLHYKCLTEREKVDGLRQNNAWVCYSRGNNEGLKWHVPFVEAIDWSIANVSELKEGKLTNSRWQGSEFYSKTGFGWVDYFTNRIKAFFVEKSPYSKNVVKFHSTIEMSDKIFTALLNSTFISYYIKNFITNTHTLQINDGKQIPVIIPSGLMEKVIESVVSIVLINQKATFENITDSLIFELYFPDHMKEKEIDILKFVEQDLKEVLDKDDFEQLPDEQKENVIEELHKRWSNPDSEIVKRMNSFAEKSPDILKPILESK